MPSLEWGKCTLLAFASVFSFLRNEELSKHISILVTLGCNGIVADRAEMFVAVPVVSAFRCFCHPGYGVGLGMLLI
jgi:hypothetical protein